MVVALLVFVLGGGTWYARKTLTDLQSRISDKQAKLALIKGLEGDQAQAARQEKLIEDKLRQSAGQDLPSFIERAAQRAQISGNLQSVREKNVSTDGNLEEKMFQVEVGKITLDQLTMFLYEVETGGYPLKIRSSKTKVANGNGQKVLNLSLEVAAYRLVEDGSGESKP